jgi:hypothetical protein
VELQPHLKKAAVEMAMVQQQELALVLLVVLIQAVVAAVAVLAHQFILLQLVVLAALAS